MSNDIEIVVKSKDATAPGLDAVKARIRDLSRQKIQIDADTEQARRKVAELKSELKAGTSGRPTVEIDADIAAAAAKVEELRRQASSIGREKATLQVDAADAQAKIQATKAALREVDGKTASANVNVDVGAALARIGIVAAALAGLAVIAGPALGIGAIVGAGLGVAVAGLSGIGGAVKALGDQTKNQGAAANRTASANLAMAAAIDQVRSAQASLKNTVASAADAERRATEQVAAAQRDLTQARADAARQLRDLAQQQQDMALAQRGAILDITQAQENLDKTMADPHATQLMRDQAQLAYDDAVQHNKDLATQADDLAATKAAADKKGVAGSDQVVAAQQRVKDAVAAAADTQRQSAFSIAQAQQAVVAAQRAVQAASMSAGAVGTSSMDKLHDAMADLTPAGQSFAKFLRGFVDGPIKDLRGAAQEGILPGIQKGMASLGPVIEKNLPAIQKFASVFGNALGGVIELAGKLAPPFLKLATVALQALSPLKGVFDGFARAFSQMVNKMVADGSLQKMMAGLVKLFGALLMALPQILPPLVDLGVVLLPLVADAIKALAPHIGQLIEWFAKAVVWLKDHLPAAMRTAAEWTRKGVTIFEAVKHAFDNIVHAGSNIGHALSNVGHAFGNVGRAVKGAYDDVTHWFGNAVDFLKGLPGKIGHAASGMWDGIKNAFKAAINWIIDVWNNMDFTISVPTVHIPGTNFNIGGGSFTLGLPDIPRLATGGIRGGLAEINEYGRGEIVRLPNGSMVLPAGQSQQMMTGGPRSGGVARLEITSDGSRLADLLIEVLRAAVRTRGGDVQVVLGRA